jgi:ferredoxin
LPATLAFVGLARPALANPAYVVTDRCIKCKYMDCVEVCPVDAFYEGQNMLVINPDECIDCGACEPECPIGAILPGTEPEALKWLDLNRKYSTGPWPNIVARGDVPSDADVFRGEADKFEKYFSSEPGDGS